MLLLLAAFTETCGSSEGCCADICGTGFDFCIENGWYLLGCCLESCVLSLADVVPVVPPYLERWLLCTGL